MRREGSDWLEQIFHVEHLDGFSRLEPWLSFVFARRVPRLNRAAPRATDPTPISC